MTEVSRETILSWAGAEDIAQDFSMLDPAQLQEVQSAVRDHRVGVVGEAITSRLQAELQQNLTESRIIADALHTSVPAEYGTLFYGEPLPEGGIISPQTIVTGGIRFVSSDGYTMGLGGKREASRLERAQYDIFKASIVSVIEEEIPVDKPLALSHVCRLLLSDSRTDVEYIDQQNRGISFLSESIEDYRKGLLEMVDGEFGPDSAELLVALLKSLSAGNAAKPGIYIDKFGLIAKE